MIRGAFKKFCNSTIKKNGNVTNCTSFFNIITTEFNAFATFFWQTVNSTKIEFFCVSLQPRREAVARQCSNPQVHDCTAGCSRLRLRTVRPLHTVLTWLPVVPVTIFCSAIWSLTFVVSAVLTMKRSRNLSRSGWSDRQKNSILVELTVCQKNVANALNSVVITLKNKLQFLTFPFFFKLQNFLNAPRKS